MAGSEGLCQRCAFGTPTKERDGYRYCRDCYEETVSAELLDDLMRQRDETVSENVRLAARLAAAESALTLVATMLRTRTIWGRTTGACPDPGCDSAACLIWRAINKAALTGSREHAQGEGE